MKEHAEQGVYEDEIDLREIFLILWRHKWIIFLITGFIVLFTTIYTVSSSKVYSVYVVMEPGVIDIASNGNYVYLDSVSNIKARLDSDAYKQRLIKSMSLNPLKDGVDFKVDLPGKANIIKVSCDVPENRIDYGIRLLEQLVKELQTDYKVDVQRKKQDYENKILLKKNKINALNLEKKDIEKKIAIKEKSIKEKYGKIGIQEESLKIVDQRITDLIHELKGVESNTQNIIQQRDKLLKRPVQNPEYGISDLLYSTTIQQNVAFFNTLKDQISNLRMEKENTKAVLQTLEKEIDELKLEIERMKIEMNEGIQTEIEGVQIEINELNNNIGQIQNLKTISEPSSTIYPVKPNTKLNIILSLFIGLLVSIFIVFFLEYLAGSKKDLKRTDSQE